MRIQIALAVVILFSGQGLRAKPAQLDLFSIVHERLAGEISPSSTDVLSFITPPTGTLIQIGFQFKNGDTPLNSTQYITSVIVDSDHALKTYYVAQSALYTVANWYIGESGADINTATGVVLVDKISTSTAGTTISCSSGSTSCTLLGSLAALGRLGMPTIGAGYYNSCIALANGTVECWGLNGNGQLGINSTTNTPSPALISSSYISNAVQVAVGTYHSCALLSDGTGKCWGLNTSNQLGNNAVIGDTGTYLTPVNILSYGGTPWSGMQQIASGAYHVCVINNDTTVSCWGRNAEGEVGLNSFGGQTKAPFPVCANSSCPGDDSDVNLSGAIQLSAGYYHTCVVLTGKTAQCWGNNFNGELGNNSTTNSATTVTVQNSPTDISALADVVQVACGTAHSCALLSNGTVACWGYNGSGALGNNSNTDSWTPVFVQTSSVDSSNLSGIIQIVAKGNVTCALANTGNVYCWGDNSVGQLGNNSTTSSSTPIEVCSTGGCGSSLGSIVQISLGEAYACAKDSSANLYCWGKNDSGQIGDGTTTERNLPVSVSY